MMDYGINPDCYMQGDDVVFVLRNLDPLYQRAAQDLGFAQVGKDFTRTFPANTPQLERICQNFCEHAATLLFQTVRMVPVPWQYALRQWMERIEGKRIDWFLGGSAALAVRGIAVGPRDFDIITDAAGAQRLGVLFADALIEPVVPVHGWMCGWFGRAFLQARFEWVGDVDERADTPNISDFGPIAAQRLETVQWDEFTLRVPPLDLQLAVSQQRGLNERVAAIEAYQLKQRAAGYREMAADTQREADATDWSEVTIKDVADDPYRADSL